MAKQASAAIRSCKEQEADIGRAGHAFVSQVDAPASQRVACHVEAITRGALGPSTIPGSLRSSTAWPLVTRGSITRSLPPTKRLPQTMAFSFGTPAAAVSLGFASPAHSCGPAARLTCSQHTQAVLGVRRRSRPAVFRLCAGRWRRRVLVRCRVLCCRDDAASFAEHAAVRCRARRSVHAR